MFSLRRSIWLLLVFGTFLCAPHLVSAETWSLSSDFSSVNNPNGVWAYGSKTTLGGSLDLYTDNTSVPISYNTNQVAGWAFSSTAVLPYVLKNVSSANWNFDGTAGGGGHAILKPGEVLLHPASLSGRYSVARWTAPQTGQYDIVAQFARFEDVQGFNSNYFVLLNGTPLTGGSGMLIGFGGSASSATFLSGPLNLSAGDTIEFAIGFGTDGTSNTDGTTIRAVISSPPQTLSDFNRDGSPDLIWQNSQTGDVSVWYMNGSIWTGNWDYLSRGIPTQWKIVGTADLNGDGKIDLLWQNTITGDVTYWLMDGIRQIDTGYIATNIPTQWKIVGAADLNSDRMADLIWQNSLTGDVTVWYMNGTQWTGNWNYIAQNVPLVWKIVGTADLNKDSKLDLIWQNDSTGDVTVWYMNNAIWTGNWNYIARGVPPAWKIATIEDLNNDGVSDLVWQNSQTGDVSVWYLTGPTWTGNWDYIQRGVPLEWKIAPKG